MKNILISRLWGLYIVMLVSLLFLTNMASAQHGLVAVSGDSALVKNVKITTSDVYSRSDGTINYQSLLDSVSTNFMVFETGVDEIERLLEVRDLQNGLMSSEWFYSESKPLFLYRTFEFHEKNPEGALWKNFKDKWAWEARIYFEQGKPKFQKVKARPLLSNDELALLSKEGETILQTIESLSPE